VVQGQGTAIFPTDDVTDIRGARQRGSKTVEQVGDHPVPAIPRT